MFICPHLLIVWHEDKQANMHEFHILMIIHEHDSNYEQKTAHISLQK